jgi:hypothetical protein
MSKRLTRWRIGSHDGQARRLTNQVSHRGSQLRRAGESMIGMKTPRLILMSPASLNFIVGPN